MLVWEGVKERKVMDNFNLMIRNGTPNVQFLVTVNIT